MLVVEMTIAFVIHVFYLLLIVIIFDKDTKKPSNYKIIRTNFCYNFLFGFHDVLLLFKWETPRAVLIIGASISCPAFDDVTFAAKGAGLSDDAVVWF